MTTYEYVNHATKRRIHWRITPPRKRSMVLRLNIHPVNFPWVAWGKVTTQQYIWPMAWYSHEEIMPETRLTPFAFAGGWGSCYHDGSICMGRHMTMQDDTETMFYFTRGAITGDVSFPSMATLMINHRLTDNYFPNLLEISNPILVRSDAQQEGDICVALNAHRGDARYGWPPPWNEDY